MVATHEQGDCTPTMRTGHLPRLATVTLNSRASPVTVLTSASGRANMSEDVIHEPPI
jgi:hypothetical protein